VFSRKQFPFILGWGCTIHKSQGMTLENVIVNLTRIFSPHQTYVALSRCKSYEGLNLIGFSKDKIFVNPLVESFYSWIVQQSQLELL
jgi:ATP-dependent DNA helicase PIF1